MLAYDEPCGEVLRHAGVGRVQAEAGSGRRWGVGVAGRGGGWRGGAGGVFQELFSSPCDHAATSSSSLLIGGARDPVHRQSAGHFSCAAETCTHSVNCADDRRDSSGAAL